MSSPVSALSSTFELSTTLFFSFARSTAFFLICRGPTLLTGQRGGGVGTAAEGDEEGQRRRDARIGRPAHEEPPARTRMLCRTLGRPGLAHIGRTLYPEVARHPRSGDGGRAPLAA